MARYSAPMNIGGIVGGEQFGPLTVASKRAELAPEAYELASRMMRPMQDYMGTTGYTQPAERLDVMGGEGRLGMSDDEFRQAQTGIQQAAAARKAEMAHQMGGASGLSPEVYYRATQGLQGQEQQAIGGLHAQRAQMERENLMRATSALAPYYSQYMGQMGNLAGLAGNIMGSANLKLGQTPGGGDAGDIFRQAAYGGRSGGAGYSPRPRQPRVGG